MIRTIARLAASTGLMFCAGVTPALATIVEPATSRGGAQEADNGTNAAAELYAARQHLYALDARCPLLSQPAREALHAGILQLRGALLRQGASDQGLDEADALITEDANATSCRDSDALKEARSLESFHQHYLRMRTLSFPAFGLQWVADRAERARDHGWALFMTFHADEVGKGRVGLSVDHGVTKFSVLQPENMGPVQSVRLMLQRPDMAGYLPTSDGPLSAPLPVRTAEAQIFFASDKRTTKDLEETHHIVWDFGFDAVSALSGADPREGFAIVFDVRSKNGHITPVRVDLAVGDFYSAAHFALADETAGS